MKILIVSANRERHPWPVPPIGACYVASNLQESGFDVQLLDLLFSDDPASDVIHAIHRFKPDLVGVSIRNIDNLDQQSSYFYLDDVKTSLINSIKKATVAPIVIGGAAVNIMPERIMDYLGVDYCISGEGEHAMVRFAEHLQSDTDISSIKGLWYRKNDQIEESSVERIATLDQLPWPRIYNWVDWPKYQNNYAPYPIQTKRGCALKCSYCVYNRIEGHHYRLRDPKEIVDEIEDIVANCRPGVIEFTDSTFNIPLQHALGICREIIKRRIKASFNTMGINPGAVTEELVTLMKEAGFIEVSCTPESGSEKILRALGKNFTLEDIKHTAMRLSKARIPVVWYFLFGGPGENVTTIRETFDFIEKYIRKKDLVFITTGIRIFPGTPIYSKAREENIIHQDTDILFPIWFKPDEIKKKTILYLINKEIITHGNYINLQDNSDTTILAKILKKVYALAGLKEPVWANIMRRDLIYRATGYNKYRLWNLEKKYTGRISDM